MKKPRVIDWNDEAQDEMLTQPGATAEPGAEPGESESVEADEGEEQAEEEEPETAGPADEDLVRLYLRNIGKRKLLTAADERVIGARISRAASSA